MQRTHASIGIAAGLLLTCAITRAQCPGEWNAALGTPGLDSGVWTVGEWDPDGSGPLMPRLIAGGGFQSIGAGGPPVNRLVEWIGSTWSTIGGGVDGSSSTRVEAIQEFQGALIVGGAFQFAGTDTTLYGNLARWDGSNWSHIGYASNGIRTMTIFEGDLIVGGLFQTIDNVSAGGLARWNGTQWTGFPTLQQGTVYKVIVWNGELYVGGSFLFINSFGENIYRIARWDGSDWRPLGSGLNAAVLSLGEFNGELIAGGSFTQTMDGQVQASHIGRWDGTQWHPLGGGTTTSVRAQAVYNGELYMNEDFVGVGYGLGRWNGSTWQLVSSGVTVFPDVTSMLSRGSELVIAGSFEAAGGLPALNIATWVEQCVSCPADLDDGSGTGTRDNAVDINDLLYFLVKFEMGDVAVDLDNGTNTGTPDNAVDINDLLYFVVRFEGGC